MNLLSSLFVFERVCSCNLTLLFVKAIGPEVYKRGISIMLVSKVTIAVRAWVFYSLTRHARLFVPTNLATSLSMRKRSDEVAILKKKRVFIPLLAPE